MKRIKIFLLSAVLIFAVAALGQGTKIAAAASVSEVQQSQPPPTIASTVDRESSTIEKQIAEAPQNVYSQVPEANALYIKAEDYLSKSNPRRGGSLANARQAVKLFESAVKKDPQFTLAYLSLADAWESFGFSVPGSLPLLKIFPHEKAAALRAVQLDDKSRSAHSLLASLYFDNAYDWANAEREFKRVIELTNSMSSHSGLCHISCYSGQV